MVPERNIPFPFVSYSAMEPFFSGFVKASPVFLFLFFGQTGQKRIIPLSAATGIQPIKGDLCILLSDLVVPFGHRCKWADLYGKGWSGGEGNAYLYDGLGRIAQLTATVGQNNYDTVRATSLPIPAVAVIPVLYSTSRIMVIASSYAVMPSERSLIRKIMRRINLFLLRFRYIRSIDDILSVFLFLVLPEDTVIDTTTKEKNHSENKE